MRWNVGAERLFGFTAEEAKGRLLWDLMVGEEDRASIRELMLEDSGKLRGNVPVIRLVDWALGRKDGTIFDAAVAAARLFD
jgi:PAS domain S-box-containing protein